MSGRSRRRQERQSAEEQHIEDTALQRMMQEAERERELNVEAQIRSQKQDRSRLGLFNDSEAERKAYYTRSLGENWASLTVYNAINLQDVIIGNYIGEDPDNIVFVVDRVPSFASTRDYVNRTLALYECDTSYGYTGKMYIGLSGLGFPGLGAATYLAFKLMVCNTNYQIFFLKKTELSTERLASHEVRYLGGSHIGSFHCQEGTQLSYYALEVSPFRKQQEMAYTLSLLNKI